jgi:hypothetical protein
MITNSPSISWAFARMPSFRRSATNTGTVDAATLATPGWLLGSIALGIDRRKSKPSTGSSVMICSRKNSMSERSASGRLP